MPTPTYTYEWLREGVPIESATGTTYTVREADSGYSLSCRVTATNTLGSAQKQSSAVKVSGSPPSDKTLPKVEGNVAVGQQLTCKPEEWKGAPPPTFTYQWFRSGDSEAIATGSTYTIETADQLHTLSCKVTATNSYGKAEAKSSNSVEVPGSAPVGELPTVAGAGEVGSKLTCQPGKWSGVPTPSFQYQWLLGSEPIPGAKTASYTVASEDAGRTVACQVTAENTYGKAVEVSKPLPIEGKAAPSKPSRNHCLPRNLGRSRGREHAHVLGRHVACRTADPELLLSTGTEKALRLGRKANSPSVPKTGA